MSKIEMPEVPTVAYAATFANLLDDIGEYAEAERFDDFIKMASSEYSDDFIKQAGLWGNIWDRMKGSLKKLFISEYRDLYESAKDSQDRLTEKVDLIKNKYKEAKSHFKNYRFSEWRNAVAEIDFICARSVSGDFDAKYAQFVNYVTEHFKEENTSEKLTKKDMMIETPEGIGKVVSDAQKKKGPEWVGPEEHGVQILIDNGNTIGLKLNKAKYYRFWRGRLIKEDNKMFFIDQDWLKKNPKKSTSVVEGLMKGVYWKYAHDDEDYIYLNSAGAAPMSSGVPKEMVEKEEIREKVTIPKDDVPEVKVPEEEIVEPTPPLNFPTKGVELGKGVVSKEKVPSEKVSEIDPLEELLQEREQELEIGTPKDPSEITEKIIDVDKDVVQKDIKELVTKPTELAFLKSPVKNIPEGTKWVRFVGHGGYAPISVGDIDPKKHFEIKDKDAIGKLTSAWVKKINDAIARKTQEASKKTQEDKDIKSKPETTEQPKGTTASTKIQILKRQARITELFRNN